MSDYINRNQAIAVLSILEVENPGADLRDARRAIADLPEPSREDKLRYALEVIRDECRKQDGTCRECPLFVAKEVGSCCEIDRYYMPEEWKPKEMIHNYDGK